MNQILPSQLGKNPIWKVDRQTSGESNVVSVKPVSAGS